MSHRVHSGSTGEYAEWAQTHQELVTDLPGVVDTDISAVVGKLKALPNDKDKHVASKRYFKVAIKGGSEVSDVFYTDDGDRDTYSLVYMGNVGKLNAGPPGTLWSSVIEKAFADKLKGYEHLDDESQTANDFWRDLVGSEPDGFSVNAETDLQKIRDVAKDADKVPAIGASILGATKVLEHHGFSILGIHGSMLELYNPHGRKEKISLNDFRSNFNTILFGSPKNDG